MAKKKRKVVKIVVTVVVLVVVVAVAAAVLLPMLLKKPTTTANADIRTVAATLGNIQTTVHGSGSVSPADSAPVYALASGNVTATYVADGDAVKKGDKLLTIDDTQIRSDITSLQSSIDSLNSTIQSTAVAGSTYIPAKVNGRVKDIKAKVGDQAAAVSQDAGYLCVISTDGQMKFTTALTTPGKVGASVSVKVGSDSRTGTITAVQSGQYTITIPYDQYTIGTTAVAVDSSGDELGSGYLRVNAPYNVTSTYGQISSVNVSENTSVSTGTTLFRLYSNSSNPDMTKALQQLADDQAQLAKDQAALDNLTLTSPADGVVSGFSTAVGTSIQKDAVVMSLDSADKFNLVVSVDELDIASVKSGQSASVNFDALASQTFTGKVSKISQTGSVSGGVASYSVTISLEHNASVLSGMSASADIVTGSADNVLLVPTSAVHTVGNQHYVIVDSGTASGSGNRPRFTGSMPAGGQNPGRGGTAGGDQAQSGGNNTPSSQVSSDSSAGGASSQGSDSGASSGGASSRRGFGGYGTASGGGGYMLGGASAGGGTMVPVQIGLTNATYTQITSGLSEGQLVQITIVSGTASGGNNLRMNFGGGIGGGGGGQYQQRSNAGRTTSGGAGGNTGGGNTGG